jgi:16S rRNA (guanine966-N2)-methyltransferase
VAGAKPRASARHATYPGEIRIIGGRWRSRKLPVLVSEGLRPTPDRVRETLFNWLAPTLPGARCLDLFAGSGALCLEALSRGAAEVVMVEKTPAVAARLRENLERLKAESARVENTDATVFLARAVEPFDIIFLDPPFASDLIAQCARLIAERGWVVPGGLVYVEAPSSMEPLPLPADWQLIRSKKAGQVGYHLARVPGAPDREAQE